MLLRICALSLVVFSLLLSCGGDDCPNCPTDNPLDKTPREDSTAELMAL